MDEMMQELVVDIRAATDGLAQDLAGVGSMIDANLSDGFERAGDRLEQGLLTALRRGGLGFEELRQLAMRSFDEIAAYALQSGIGALFGGSQSGLGGLLGQSLGALLGLPGRATGGPVSPGASYLVGERGPEVFIPTSAGMIAGASDTSSPRDVQVRIDLRHAAPSSAPTAMRRSSRQIASAVRRALVDL
jgi:hypothetical protein